MLSLETKYHLIQDEIIQAEEEGKETVTINEDFKNIDITKLQNDEFDKFYNKILSLPYRADWYFKEPDDIYNIKKLSKPPEEDQKYFSWDILCEKVVGAWFGRISGNMLGKPVEGWPKQKIESYLRKVNSYPLDYYFPAVISESDDAKISQPFYEEGCFRGMINSALRDDDIDYTILNLLILEKKGKEMTTEDVATEWLNQLPLNMTYTAERVAYRNIALGISPPKTATFWNPFREWIGAMIRADAWGYVNPSRPWSAAELAYKDARLSHTKNGIYGEVNHN